jgi:hypothetical protein
MCKGAGDVPLDGASGHTQVCRDRCVAKSLEPVEQKGVPCAFRQLVQSAAQAIARLIDEGQLVGRRGGIVELRRELEDRIPPAGFAEGASLPVDDQVAGDRKEVRWNLPWLTPKGPMLEQPEIGFLHDVIDVPGEPDEAADKAPK